MATNLGSAYFELIPSMAGFSATVGKQLGGTQRIAQTAGVSAGSGYSTGFVKSIGNVAATTGKVLAGGLAAAGAAVAGIAAGKGLSRALDIQDAQKKLSGLGHSAKSVTMIMDNALSSVKGTAFGLGDAATVAASAVAAGIKPGKDLTKYLKTTADAATIAGTSLGDMGQILNAANANGTVYTDTLNQLSSRGVPVFQYLQKEYGVTADALSTMVRKGQVDAKTLDKVLAENLGGAALKSGETARGAFANVGAALGRLGVQFGAGAGVAAAPALFTAIAAAIDRAGAALKPYSDQISAFITTVAGQATTFINGIDFGEVVAQVQTIVGQVKAALSGMFTGIKTGDLSSFGATFSDIHTIITPLFPLFVTLAKSVGQLAGAFGQVITAGIPLLPPILNLLAGALGFVADHIGAIAPLLPVIVAGIVLWRSATTGVAAANRVLTAAQLALLPVTLANTTARLAAANAEIRLAAAQGLAIPGMFALTAAAVRQAAATVLSTGAMVAASAATKIAAAGQWLLNAALSANPIGIIIVLIAALVAGLIFFFTQTQLGKEVFANVVTFIQGAIGGLVSFFQTVFGAIGAFFAQYGLIILAGVAPIIGIPILIATHWNQIVGIISAALAPIVGIVTGIFGTVRAYIGAVIGVIKTVISAGLAIVVAIFTGNWGAIPGIIAGAVGRIGGIIRGLVGTVLGLIRQLPSGILSAVGNFGSLLVNSGRSLIQGFIDGIKGMLGAVGSAVGGIMDFVKGFFPHSPAKRGPFSGAGWTAIGKSGAALGKQFTSGFDASVQPTFNAGALTATTVAPASMGGGTQVLINNKTNVRLEDLIDVQIAKGDAEATRVRRLGYQPLVFG